MIKPLRTSAAVARLHWEILISVDAHASPKAPPAQPFGTPAPTNIIGQAMKPTQRRVQGPNGPTTVTSGLDLGFPVSQNSLSRALGIGGYHTVIRVESSINAGKYETKIRARWVSSGGTSENMTLTQLNAGSCMLAF